MLMKFYFVSIYAALSFDFIVRATRIPAFKCMQHGWELCNIHQIDISPADRMVEDRSCFVDRGSNVTIAFNFTPRFETYNLKWSVCVETVIGDYKIEGISEDARNLTNYPTIENKINEFKSVIHIPDNTKAKLWVVRVTITGEGEHDVCCFLCEIRVREPLLTTKSSTVFDPTNPYDILRKSVSYPTIWDFNDVVKNFQNNTDVFDKFVFSKAVITHKPGFWSIIKNGFRRLLGFSYKPYIITTPKIPFLGNASSFMEYMNNVIGDQANQFYENVTSTVGIETFQTEGVSEIDEITTEETMFDFTTEIDSSSVTEPPGEENVNESKTDDIDRKSITDEGTETESSENDSDKDQTSTTTVETTYTKPKTRIRTTPVRRKPIARNGPRKVSRAGIKKTAKRIAKSTNVLKT